MRLCAERGFSLVELLIVMALVGLIVAISLKGGDGGKERQVGERGRMNLITIFNSEKRHKIDTGSYLLADGLGPLNAGLGLDLRDAAFTYKVMAGPDGFVASARRVAGRCAGKVISISAGGGEVLRGCPAW
ncbi:MAG: type II secretion system protein [Elusimicrobia bacterium]|nr:type II secretion system protein [Elusimicrobiota bacterium]